MKFNEISKRYTEIVMSYLNSGYYFNTTTMGGTQGEMAHTDLIDGETIIRVFMGDFKSWRLEKEGVEIVVGKCTDEVVKPNNRVGKTTIWNNALEVISTEKFYQIGRVNRSGEGFYGTDEEATRATKKRYERYETKRTCNFQELSGKAKEIVFSYIKRQPKCKTVKLSDIEKVYRITEHNSSKDYYVVAKGKCYRLK